MVRNPQKRVGQVAVQMCRVEKSCRFYLILISGAAWSLYTRAGQGREYFTIILMSGLARSLYKCAGLERKHYDIYSSYTCCGLARSLYKCAGLRRDVYGM